MKTDNPVSASTSILAPVFLASKRNVVIIGAGLAGLICAIAMKKTHGDAINITIYEKATQFQNLGGALLLLPHGVKQLRALGLDHIIEKFYVKINYTLTHDEKGEQIYKGDLNKFYEKTGDCMLTVERSLFQRLLIEELEKMQIKIHLNHTCIDVTETISLGVFATLKNSMGSIQISPDLLIAADGAHSFIREKIQPQATLHYTGLCVWGGVLNPEDTVDLPRDHAYFQPWHNAGIWICPVSGGKQGFYAYYRMEEKEFNPANRNEKLKQLKELYKDKISQPYIAKILSAPENEHTFALTTHELHGLNSWTNNNGRIVFVGDAAHATGPTQGFNTSNAICDAYVLAHCLEYHAGNIPAATKAYENIRIPVVKQFTELEAEDSKVSITGDHEVAHKRNSAIKQLDPNAPLSEWRDLILRTNMEDQLAQITITTPASSYDLKK